MTVPNRPHRANNEGSIYWVAKTQRWARAVTLSDGKREVRTFKLESEAKASLKKALKAVEDGEIAIASARLSTATYLLGWLDNVVKPSFKPLTHESYEYIVKSRLIPAFGKVPLVNLGPQHVARLQAGMLERGLSINTIKAMRIALSSALSTAVEHKLIPRNPVVAVKPPRSSNPDDEDKEPRVFTRDEVNAFLSAAAGDEFEPLFRFMLATGLRPGEARGVRWQDVDAGKRVLWVRRQSVELKGG